MSPSIPMFRGQNFEFWKFKLTVFLESKGLKLTLQHHLEGDKSWVRDDAKARMYILESVDDRHVELIMQETSAKDMIDRLESMYSVLNFSDLANDSKNGLRDDFLALKLRKGGDPTQFFREFESHVDSLRDSGNCLSPKEILECLRMAVGNSYRYLFDEVNTRLEPLEAGEWVKKRILGEHAARTNSTKAVNGSRVESLREKFKEAFKDEGQECYRCGQSGHWARECPQPKECFKCGQEGHLKFQCLQQPESCYGCGKAGHRKFECPDLSQPFQQHSASAVKHRSASTTGERTSAPSRRQSNDYNSAKSPIQDLQPLMASPVSPPEAVNGEEPTPNGSWVLDSCATYHTVCDESLFSKCVSLDEPRSVEGANGNTLSTSKMGEVRIGFRAGSRCTVKNLTNVYLMEELEQNILSVQRLVQFGGSVLLKSSTVELRDANNEIITFGKKIENLYVVKSYSEVASNDVC